MLRYRGYLASVEYPDIIFTETFHSAYMSRSLMSALLRLCITLCVLAPALVQAAVLGIPSSGFTYSGVGVISGWKCEANGPLTVHIYDEDMVLAWDPIPLVYGTERTDVRDVGACARADVGFVAIWNWGNLGGDGIYTAVVYDNAVEFARSTFTVTTLGEAFITGASGECTIPDFPAPGESARFAWNQTTQGLVLVSEPPSPGPAPSLEFPLRALHAGGHWGFNEVVAREWEAAGQTGPLIPLDYIAWLKSLHVNWVGLSVALHYDDSMDSTVERVYSSDAEVSTFSDDVLRRLIREFHSHGLNVYLTLALQDEEAVTAARPAWRWQLGDPGTPETGVPPEDPAVFGKILPEFWPWRPDHPDHQRFVAEFWETYTQQAVHFARLAEEEGVRLYSLGTETDRIFRTRSGGDYWINDFGQELTSMVARVRTVYSGLLTYDMHYSALVYPDHDPSSAHLWEDLDLDLVGVSAWFPLMDAVPTTVPSVATLQAIYEQIFQDYLIPVVERNPDRPMVFLEYGATDTLETLLQPGGSPSQFRPFVFTDANGNGQDDGRETQANMYQALLNTMDQHPGVVNGFFPWGNVISSDALWASYLATHRSFGIRGKPVEAVVRRAYEGYKNQ